MQKIRNWRTIFLQRRDFFSISDDNEKLCSQFTATASHKIDETAYGIHRDHPSTFGVKKTYKNHFSELEAKMF